MPIEFGLDQNRESIASETGTERDTVPSLSCLSLLDPIPDGQSEARLTGPSHSAPLPDLHREVESVALREERQRVVEDDLANQCLVMAPPAKLEDEFRHRQRIAVAPVTRRVDHDPIGAVHLDHVGRASGCTLGDRIERHPHPVAGLESQADGVLLHVVDAHAVGLDPRMIPHHVQDHPRSLILVNQVRRVDQHELIVTCRQVEVLLKDDGLIACSC